MTAQGPPGSYYTPAGYLTIYAPWHPLANATGTVSVARAVLYAKVGPGEHPCHHCGKTVEWGSTLQADHLNWARLDNSPENLVPSCASCNSKRTIPT
jgi:hypothetical protein